MSPLPKTKIIATIGPSSWDEDVLTEMINSGVSIARINASFADFAELERVKNLIRKISPRVAVMLDTQGHKIRVTGFETERNLLKGDQLILISEGYKVEKENQIKVTYPTLERDVARGSLIMIDDGNIQLKVADISGHEVICEVIMGGILKKAKTVNIPGANLIFDELSPKDTQDIRFAVENGFDLISASFIRNYKDVRAIRDVMGEDGKEIKLVAKIEDYHGVENFDEILEAVDAIMIARGDLGVELPLERVPLLQKEFIYKCRNAGKPVIVATQMLESMRQNTRPTRAEASDVANAVLDGTDAVMLSAETSTGEHPVEAVKTIAKIALAAEKATDVKEVSGRTLADEKIDLLAQNIELLIKELNLSGIVVLSKTGHTLSSLTRHRYDIPIWSMSGNPLLIRQEQLYCGVTSIYMADFNSNIEKLIQQSVQLIYGRGELELDSNVLILASGSLLSRKSDTLLQIVNIKETLGDTV